jgi:rfaE bifunctional protein kinase chain/domain/rfaE bifunctional protein nucleotidyltransferase chain/domain
MTNKIYNLLETKKLIQNIKNNKNNKKIIGLCHGVFDLMHIGHIKHFQKAKKLCDFLLISVTSDRFVQKGTGRPVFSQKSRMESLAALECVDAVILSDKQTSEQMIRDIKPNIYFKGSDYKNNKADITGKIKIESALVKKCGGKTIYTNEETSSSSFLINTYSNFFNEEQKEYLKNFKKKFSFNEINRYFEKIKKIRVLVIGETIIDEYIYSEALGKSGKESYLAIKELSGEYQLGGAAAIAKHLSAFCNKVNLLSMVGQKKEHISFIKKKLGNKIKKNFIYKKDSPTILKRRYLDFINKNKLLGIYNINDQELNEQQNKILIKKYKSLIKKSDLVIISDYGHGFINKKFIKVIEKKNNFIYLNAQINAGNVGYHSIRNYKKINCLIINETELRHEMRDKLSDVVFLAKQLQNKINVKKIVITRGKLGAIMIDKKNKKVLNCPAFAQNVVDKVGAGDTMLSVICLFLQARADDNLSLFMGSLAGSISVGIMGNSAHLSKETFIKQVETTLK